MSNQDKSMEYANAETPYVVELSDEGCGECGKGRMWDVVFKREDIAGSTTYADADEAQHEADLCNHAYERGREAAESQVVALQEQVKALSDAVKQLLDGHFPDLCYGPCEHIDCKEARKAREFAMSALSQVPAQKEQGGL